MKRFSKIVALMLVITMIMTTGFSFAGVRGVNSDQISDQIKRESFSLNGEDYVLERNITNTKVVATVYNNKNEIVAQSEALSQNNILNNSIISNNISRNSEISLSATPNYKYANTLKGSFKPVAWTTVAVIAALAALNPGAAVAGLTALASAIITDAGGSYYYKLIIYTAEDSTYHYQKNILKIYRTSNDKKVGPDLVGYTKLHKK